MPKSAAERPRLTEVRDSRSGVQPDDPSRLIGAPSGMTKQEFDNPEQEFERRTTFASVDVCALVEREGEPRERDPRSGKACATAEQPARSAQ